MLSNSEIGAKFAPVIGAEAKILLVDWHGREAICKARIPKVYRNEKLDHWLRSKRTKEEAAILHFAKLLGVDCPVVFFADPENTELVMEYIRGVLLRDRESLATREDLKATSSLSKFYLLLGKYAARLHSGNLIHGDLTTKNVIISYDNRLVLIDFGLSFNSQRIEDRAEDLHLLKQAVKSSVNPERAKTIFEKVTSGYRSISGGKMTEQVLSQIEEIERRGRYARVD